MAWVGIVLGICFFTPVGFLGFGLTGIWIIVASVLMYQRAGSGDRVVLAQPGASPEVPG